MQVVALDLRGPSEMAFDQDRIRVAPEGYRSRVMLGTSGNDIFRLANVGHDGLQAKLAASGHTGEAEGSTHDLEESATRNRVEPLRGAFGKFAMQRLLERRAAGKFFQRAPVSGAGLLFSIVRGGRVDFFADRGQIQFLGWADVIPGFNLDQAAVMFFVVRHSLRDYVPSPLGAFSTLPGSPTLMPWALLVRRFAGRRRLPVRPGCVAPRSTDGRGGCP